MRAIPPETREELEKLERKHAENPEGRYFVPLANSLRKAGEFYRAKALLREGLGRYPDYVSAHIVLGRCLQDEGSRGEAEFRFRHVLTLDPQNLVALRTLGEIAAAAGRVDEARSWYRELLVVDPMNEEARLALDELPPEPAEEAGEAAAALGDAEAERSAVAAETVGESPAEMAVAGDEEVPGFEEGGEGQVAGANAEGAASFAAPEEGEAELVETNDLSAVGSIDTIGPATGSAERHDLTGSVDEHGEEAGALPQEAALVTAGEEQAQSAPDDGIDAAREVEALRGEATLDASESGEEATPEDDLPSPLLEAESAWNIDEMYLFGAAGTMLDLGRPAPTAPEELYGREDALATETLAELYTRQGFFDRAARVYRELIRRRGSDSRLQEKLARVERLAAGEEDPFADSFASGFPTESPAVPEDAPAELSASGAQEDEGPQAQSIRDYLQGILSWAPAPGTLTQPAEETTTPDVAAPVGEAELPAPTAWEDLEADDGEDASELADVADSGAEKALWEEPTVELREEAWEGMPLEPGDEPVAEPVVEAEAWTSTVDTERAESSADEAPPPAPEDDLFPWELPPSSSTSSGSPAASVPAWPSADPAATSPFEPAVDRVTDAESTAPSGTAGSASPEDVGPRQDEADAPAGGSATGEPTSSEQEDDDLESFQAWLRSLRR